MYANLALHPRLFLAPETQGLQTNILGLPWWVWLLGLIVVIILLYLLLRPAPPETKPFIEEKSTETPAKAAPPAPEVGATAPEASALAPEAVAPEPEPPPAAPPPFIGEMESLDDLTIVEGIGPKISGALREAGIDSFKKLAETSPARISEILKAAGITLFDASSWPEQAALIAEAKWTELRALQDKLIAGRRE